MSLFKPADRHYAEAIEHLAYSNPFLPERIQHEKDALGDEFVEEDANWNLRIDSGGMHPNIRRLVERAGTICAELRDRLAGSIHVGKTELVLYEDLLLFYLYHKYLELMGEVVMRPADEERSPVRFHAEFARDFEHFLCIPGRQFPVAWEPAHLFACFFQVRRAFHHTFSNIIGASPSVMRLRAAVWQSIFTYDMRRYRRCLFDRMGDIACLITGPSGTGKELVARAVGLSRYIPFDAQTRSFTEESSGSFHALNLSALSPTLIESELFGHKRGAFTGALADRIGWLEACRPLGTVFLDEIGELDAGIQVKLLRVLQSRTFQRLGESKPCTFVGKIIAATNRDLAQAMQTGRFREDFYYRLCSDIIVTPSLHEQLAEDPDQLPHLVSHLARRIVGEEADSLARDVVAWIEKNLGRDYAWPGNVRELEQCVRNVLIRGQYRPQQSPKKSASPVIDKMMAGRLTADELLDAYCLLVYFQTGSYLEAARKLRLDRRTVKTRVENAARRAAEEAP